MGAAVTATRQAGLTDQRATCDSRCLSGIGDASGSSQMLFWSSEWWWIGRGA